MVASLFFTSKYGGIHSIIAFSRGFSQVAFNKKKAPIFAEQCLSLSSTSNYCSSLANEFRIMLAIYVKTLSIEGATSHGKSSSNQTEFSLQFQLSLLFVNKSHHSNYISWKVYLSSLAHTVFYLSKT